MTVNLLTQHIVCENCGASSSFVKLTALAMGTENPVCCDEARWDWRATVDDWNRIDATTGMPQ